jgi:UDP-N-acetylglucosamine enolpyruvyl transferase
MDVIFYFVLSMLVATVLCYLVFLLKNAWQREDIKKEVLALQTVGTEEQKSQEKEVINYRRKINDFSL